MKNKINQAKIEEAIADFEKDLDFEFVPVIAKQSSYTGHVPWILSLLFLLSFVVLIDVLQATIWADSWSSKVFFYAAAPFVAVVLGFLLDKSDWVDRFFIYKNDMQKQVHEKAQLTFFEHRLHELKSHNAILLYISILERRIVLLHDPRTKMQNIDAVEQKILVIIQAAFKQKRYEGGLLEAITELKKTLAQTHQRTQKAATENLVANKIIWVG